jgi:hypothetical protein
MNTQALITSLARQTDHVERHGDVLAVRPYDGATFHDGDYLKVRLFEVTFEDGSETTFFIRMGAPLVAHRTWTTARPGPQLVVA